MTNTNEDEGDLLEFRKRNRAFAWVATLASAAIIAFITLTLLVVALKGDVMSTDKLQRTALAWFPVIFYLWALLSARELFAALSREGFAFHGAIARGLLRIGWALATGATASVVVGIVLLFTNPGAMGGFPVFNAPGLTIGVVGLALVAIGHLVRKAEQIRRKNVALAAELEDFL